MLELLNDMIFAKQPDDDCCKHSDSCLWDSAECGENDSSCGIDKEAAIF
jgi:hypothetical protein